MQLVYIMRCGCISNIRHQAHGAYIYVMGITINLGVFREHSMLKGPVGLQMHQLMVSEDMVNILDVLGISSTFLQPAQIYSIQKLCRTNGNDAMTISAINSCRCRLDAGQKQFRQTSHPIFMAIRVVMISEFNKRRQKRAVKINKIFI